MPWTRNLWQTWQSPGSSEEEEFRRTLSDGEPFSAANQLPRTHRRRRHRCPVCPLVSRLVVATAVVVVVILVVSSPQLCDAECPYPCDCKWKAGKETVDCKRAGLMVVPNDIDGSTQVLDISHNNLQILPKDTFRDVHLIHLQRIYMTKCSLSQIDSEAFRSLSNLVELDISFNQMTYVPTAALREVSQLRRFLITGNPLKQLQAGSFAGLSSLETLELTLCDIEFIDVGAFEGLPRLTLLKLDSNLLQTLGDVVVAPMAALNELHLHGNPWRCDCRLRALRTWMLSHNVPFQVPPKCSLPARLRNKTWNELHLDDYVCEPQITVESDASEYAEGDNATLTCHVSADPEPSVWWAWQGQPIGNSSSVSAGVNGELFVVSEEYDSEYDKVSRLSIVYTDKSNSGTYSCVAENGGSPATANLTVKVGGEQTAAEIKSSGGGSIVGGVIGGLAVSHITGIVVGLTLVIVTLVAVLCFFTMKCKHNTPVKGVPDCVVISGGSGGSNGHHKYAAAAAESNHVLIDRELGDELLRLEQQTNPSLLGPNPIRKPPRLGMYHGVPTVDLDHQDETSDGMSSSSPPPPPPPLWQTQVVVEFASAADDDDHDNDNDGVGKCLTKDASLRPIVEEMIVNGRESEEGDDSGLELDRGGRDVETHGLGFGDQDSDRERHLKEKNRRNQEKRTPLCPRDPSAIERELNVGRDRPRRPLTHNFGGGGGGGGDSTCSSSDPPTVPSSPQRHGGGRLASTPSRVKLLRTGRPASLDDDDARDGDDDDDGDGEAEEDGTEV